MIAALFFWLVQGEIEVDHSPAGRLRAAYVQHLKAFPGDINATRFLATYELEENLRPDNALRLLQGVQQPSAAIERLRALANRTMAERILQRIEAGAAARHAVIAHFHFVDGRYREAFAYYRKALQTDPKFPQAHAAIAEIYRQTGHPDWAATEATLEKAVPLDDRYHAVVDHLQAERKAIAELMQFADCWEKVDLQARAAREQKDYAKALELALKAQRLSPDNAAVERSTALILFHDQQYAAALPMLEKHKLLHVERTIALLELGEPAKALATLGLSSDEFENAKLMGRIFIELNKAMIGIPKLQAETGKDIDGSLHEILGRAYQSLHQPNPAGLALRRASELRKRFEAAKEIVAPK